MRLLLLLAFVATASAFSRPIKFICEQGWEIYSENPRQTTCMRVMEDELKFPDAYKACIDIKAHLVTFSHRWPKVEFVNKLILAAIQNKNETLNETETNMATWFVDREGVHPSLIEDEKLPDEYRWMVIKPSQDSGDIKLAVNSLDMPRRFICEKPAVPVAQRVQFSMQPDDVQMSADMLKKFEEELEDKEATPTPFLITFNCHALGLPKPQIRWVMTKNFENGSMSTEYIEPKIITDRRVLNQNLNLKEPVFFDTRRDCTKMPCHDKSIHERSQLALVGAQLFNTDYSIACVGMNEFGSVMSREAKIIISTMEQFPKEEPIHHVKASYNTTIACDLETNPDSASVEWVRLVNDKMEPLEMMNAVSGGNVQMSKATFDLIIDHATPELAGRYACIVKMRNGRGRKSFVTRRHIVRLIVEPCEKSCNPMTKPISVVPGYPTFLSMNSLSNEIIRHGDNFQLECPCTGKRDMREQLEVEWKMPEETTGEIVPILPRGSAMLMRKADDTFSGTYHCRCLREGETSSWHSVEIDVLPRLVPKVEDVVKVKVGEKATITCEIPEFQVDGLTLTVLPMRGAESLVDLLRNEDDTRFKLTAVGQKYTITIENVKETDADVYGCRVRADFFSKFTDTDTFYTSLQVEK